MATRLKETAKSRCPHIPNHRVCPKHEVSLRYLKRKKEWWLVEGGGTANKTSDVLSLPLYGNTTNTRRGSPIPGKSAQKKLKAGCDSIAILDMS